MSSAHRNEAGKSLPTVLYADVLKPLSKEAFTPDVEEMVSGRRKTWLASFMTEHLPENRLKSSDDDLSKRFQSLSKVKTQKKKKKKVKSKARIALDINTALARRQIQCRKIAIAPEDVRFKTYIPLRDMWLKYIADVISLPNVTNENKHVAAQKIMKADLHGCPIMVQKSKCPSFIGVTGIVIQETRNMFVIVTAENKLKRIPKGNNVFSFVLGDFVFTIHGNQFKVKPGERATKKFKSKPTIDL